MINNVLYDELPTEWHGYKINTSFRIGIQLVCCMNDKELSDDVKAETMATLLFYDEELGTLRDYPTSAEEIGELLNWYINGWNHDKHKENENKQKVMDFFVDQWRIYADFRQIYNINLNEADLHFWEFMALLWNMPNKLSSFLQVIDMRTRKPSKRASQEEKKAIADAKAVYGLDQDKPALTEEQKAKIDEYDAMMAEIKKKKQIAKEVEAIMGK